MARVQHRAIATCDLDEYAPPSSTPTPVEGDTMAPMRQDGSDPAAIVVSRRTLGWAGAALFALFSGGQIASVKLSDDGPDPQTVALSARVDQLSAKMDQLSADGEARDARFTKILNAVLIWQLEQDRYYRESRQPSSPPRSQELEAASQRLRDLATEF